MIGRPPDLSIVVAATDGPPAVARTLASLARSGDRVEVIVATAGFAAPGAPGLLTAPAGTGTPRLRRLGLEAATGRVVAFTEDSCLAGPGWAEAWIAAFADPGLVAASGVVDRDEEAAALDRAVFLCEYAPFYPPAPAGPPKRLAGNNFAVLREVGLHEAPAEVHETALLAAIRRAGGSTRTVGDAAVRHVRRFGPGEAFRDRLRFGFEFGRLRSRTGWGQIIGLIAGPAILAAQVGRLAALARRTPRLLAGPLATLPLTLGLLAAWSLGEWAGWAWGPPAPARRDARRRRGKGGRSLGRGPARAGSRATGCRSRPPAA